MASTCWLLAARARRSLRVLALWSGAAGAALSPGVAAQGIPQLQEQAIRDPALDALCPGWSRHSAGVGADCWARIWIHGGCRAESTPPYEQWHHSQTLEVLIADVVQWANLPDAHHRQVCHGLPGSPAHTTADAALDPGGRPVSAAAAVQRAEELLALVQHAGQRPVVLEFWSETCGFCVIMLPVFQLLAEKYKGRAHFVTVDVQAVPQAAELFQVMGLPAFKVVMNGQVVQQVDGADTQGLEAMVQQAVEVADRLDGGGRIPDAVPPAGASDVRAGLESVDSMQDQELARLLQAIQQEMHRRELLKAQAVKNPCAEFRAQGKQREGPNFVERLVILGAGPAGLAAALYGARAGLCPLVVSPPAGGQLMAKGVDVENFPGVARSRGSAIVQQMKAQAASFFAAFQDNAVISVDLRTRPFRLHVNSTSEADGLLLADALIVATGADSRWLGVRGEQELRGLGVSSCAACDGYLFRSKECAVIGGGDAAMEEALLLGRICASVTVVHRRDRFRAGQLLQERVLQHPKVTVLWHMEVQEFQSENPSLEGQRLSALLLRDVRSGTYRTLRVHAAFVAIGHDPNTEMFRGQLQMDENGYLETPAKPGRSSYTSVPGCFAAGDVADPSYRQAVTSAGSGAAAALDAERWLSKLGARTAT